MHWIWSARHFQQSFLWHRNALRTALKSLFLWYIFIPQYFIGFRLKYIYPISICRYWWVHLCSMVRSWIWATCHETFCILCAKICLQQGLHISLKLYSRSRTIWPHPKNSKNVVLSRGKESVDISWLKVSIFPFPFRVSTSDGSKFVSVSRSVLVLMSTLISSSIVILISFPNDRSEVHWPIVLLVGLDIAISTPPVLVIRMDNLSSEGSACIDWPAVLCFLGITLKLWIL